MKPPLTQYSVANYPENGWIHNDKIIMPPSAYTDSMDFIKAVLDHFPAKKEKFLSIFSGNNLRMFYLQEMATFLLCQWLNKKFNNFKDGEPCSHPGCCHHITHPCEGCGRIGCHQGGI